MAPPPPVIKERAYVAKGLEDQDDHIDLLTGYFTEMQKTTVETSQPDDFLSFASCAHYFGVIMLETITTPVAGGVVDDDDDDDDESRIEVDAAPVEPMPIPESVQAPALESESESGPLPAAAAAAMQCEGDDSVYPPSSSRATSPPDSDYWEPLDTVSAQRLQELQEAAVTTPTETLFNRLSERDKVLIWREAFMADLEENADQPLVPIPPEEPGVRPIYANDDWLPEFDGPEDNTMATDYSYNDSDLINWPNDGPPGGENENVWKQPPTSLASYARNAAFNSGWNEEEPIGREYLEPETGPVQELVPIPQDPAIQKLVYDSAVAYQKSLRETRVRNYLAARRSGARTRTRTPAPPTTTREPIGLIYLWTSQTFLDPLHMGECGLGLYIAPEYRGKECLPEAVEGVLKVAFSDPECHRLQSIIVENPEKLYNLDILARLGFRNEGIRRRAFFSSKEYEWKDVTYFAMLVTEWVYDNNNDNRHVHLRTKSLWDEVFARHQKECDDLIRLEEKSSLKRSASIETIRERMSSSQSVANSSETGGDTTDDAASTRLNVKRRRLNEWKAGRAAASDAATSSGLDSDWEITSPVGSTSPTSGLGAHSHSDVSPVAGPSRRPPRLSGQTRRAHAHSNASTGSASGSSSSQWDLLF